MFFLGVVLSAQPTFAHDAPVIAPTRLDFGASQAPKTCNDKVTFRNLLATWVPLTALVADAERQLVVRIRRSSTGEKLAEVKLVDATGATLKKHDERYGVQSDCHRVLYESARAAAKLLGAFDKPPPPEPPEPLVCPTPPAPAKHEPCPACPAPSPSASRSTLFAPHMPRFSLGAGVFLGMTSNSNAFVGPSFSLGFVPWSRWPGVHVQFDGAWAPRQTLQTVPVFASLCHAHHGLRLCGGLLTTFYSVEDKNEARDFTLSASLRIGAEFGIAGPFSIRTDVFTILPLTQRIPLDSPNPFAAGALVMGVWSFE